MLFGSDEMYNELKQAVYGETDDYDKIYQDLFECIKIYTVNRLKKGFRINEVKARGVTRKDLDTSEIHSSDYDDIVIDVFDRVFKYLDRFVNNCEREHYIAPQRQSWLRLQIHSACVDYLKNKIKFSPPTDIEDKGPKADERMLEFHELLKDVIHSVCTYKTDMPEKIMAYIFNVVIFKEYGERRENASAKTTLLFMNGKTMFVLKNEMCIYIYDIFYLKLNSEDISSIVKIVGDKAPTEAGNKICNITTKKITDWTNRIKTHVIKELYKKGVCYNG